MFTRPVFYALRDVAAALSGEQDACLRFSNSALELEFRLLVLKEQLQVSRWLQLGFALIIMSVSWLWPGGGGLWRGMVAVFGLFWLVGFFRARPAPPFTAQPGPDAVRIRYSAAEAIFHFELLKPGAGVLPLGAELPVAAIQAVRVRRMPSHDDEQPPLGLVEVQTAGLPYRLFAALPSEPSAQNLARALRLIIGLPADNTPAPWWQEAQSTPG